MKALKGRKKIFERGECSLKGKAMGLEAWGKENISFKTRKTSKREV